MRLLDQVAQSKLAIDIEDSVGLRRVSGAGEFAEALLACPTRLVVDDDLAEYCRTLATTDRGMLAGENDFLRVPASPLWLEWPCRPTHDAMSGRRTGLLVTSTPDGRSGSVTTFWEQSAGDPVVAQMMVEFALDEPTMIRRAIGGAHALRAGSHPLSPHLYFTIRPEWDRHFAACSAEDLRMACSQIVANILPGAEMLFIVSALLSERVNLRRENVDLHRLNRHRLRRGKAPLLDHVEVRLDLAAPALGISDGRGHGREPARLHSVRGHMVDRAGRTFWRRSHLRGDAARSARTRTVIMTRGKR